MFFPRQSNNYRLTSTMQQHRFYPSSKSNCQFCGLCATLKLCKHLLQTPHTRGRLKYSSCSLGGRTTRTYFDTGAHAMPPQSPHIRTTFIRCTYLERSGKPLCGVIFAPPNTTDHFAKVQNTFHYITFITLLSQSSLAIEDGTNNTHFLELGTCIT